MSVRNNENKNFMCVLVAQERDSVVTYFPVKFIACMYS